MDFLVLVLVGCLSFLPGYLVLCHLSRADPDLREPLVVLAAGAGVSVVAVAGIGLAASGLAHCQPGVTLLLYGLLCVGLALPWRDVTPSLRLRVPARLIVLAGLWLAYLLLLLLFTPTYKTGFAVDWEYYYANVFYYLGRLPATALREPYVIEYLCKRTPFMSLYGAFACGLCGVQFRVFQLSCLFLNALILWAVLLFVRDAFRRTDLRLALLLCLISPALIRCTVVPEPKMVGAFFVLLTYRFYARYRDPTTRTRANGLLAAVFSVSAVMFHPSMLFYVVWCFVDSLILDLRRDRRPGPLWGFAAISAIGLALPWFCLIGARFGWRELLRPVSTLSEPLPLGWVQYVWTRGAMVFHTLVYPQVHCAIPPLRALTDFSAQIGPSGAYREFGHAVLRFYEQTYLGGMTVSVGLLALIIGWRRALWRAVAPGQRHACLWAVLGAVLCFIVHLSVVDRRGHATNLTAPLYVLVLGCACQALSVRGGWVVWSALALGGAEYAVGRWLTFRLTWGTDKMGLLYVSDTAGTWYSAGGMLSAMILVLLVASGFWLLGQLEPGLGQPEAHRVATGQPRTAGADHTGGGSE